MKIIKYGEGYPMQIGCTKCRSILEIEPGDILSQKTMLGVAKSVVKSKILQYVVCPVCGETNIVNEEIVDHVIGR